MRTIDALCDWHLHRTYDSMRERFLAHKGIQAALEGARDQMRSLMEDTALWHGTGKKHYENAGTSKYAGVRDRVRNSLASILQNGLQPQFDLFSYALLDGVPKTVSHTRQRMYARTYACMHQPRGERLGFEYGSRSFWSRYFVLGTFALGLVDTEGMLFAVKRKFTQPRNHRATSIHPNAWFSSLRKPDGKEPSRNRTFVEVINGSARTDIAGNYPLIIGIRRNAVTPLRLRFNVGTYETRSASNIPPNDFTHIQVPWANVHDARRELERAGCSAIPVHPIEFAEVLASEQSFFELTH